VIGAGIGKVQGIFSEIYALGPEFRTDGSQFDILIEDGEEIDTGPLPWVLSLHRGIRKPVCPTGSTMRSSSATPFFSPITGG